MRISDWSSDVCSSDLRHPRAPRAPAPPAPCRSIAPGRNSPRIGGQRLDHALVEHTRLVAVENGAHREEMFQRFLLQRPHDLMAVVDRLGHARAIAMFGLDRLRKPHIGGAHLLLQRMPTEIGRAPWRERGCQYV